VAVAGLALAAPSLRLSYYQTPDQPVDAGIQLLGYTIQQEEAGALYIFPYWHVKEAPGDLVMQWHLLDSAGDLVTSITSFPYFNTLRAFQWSTNMIVDDAYYLPLPPGLASGVYTLALTVLPAGTEVAEGPVTARAVGDVTIARDVAPLPALDHPMQIGFQTPDSDNLITLRGYRVTPDASLATPPQTQSAAADLTVAPGDTVIYSLAWQAAQSVREGTQVFVQLLDHHQTTVTQVNQPLVLNHGAPYSLWNPYWLRENHYQLQIPGDAAGGLYHPYIGLYDRDSGTRFAAYTPGSAEAVDGVFLPPLKVARRVATPLANPVSVRFGDAIGLESYALALPRGELTASAIITLTLQYRSLALVKKDYTQFVHLHSPELGMAAQLDAPPQGNPTSSWVEGEVIVEVVPLTIAPDAKPGAYVLSLGFYDPRSGGARLPVMDEANQRQPDERFVIEEVEIK
jgi:hypothetical protein